MKFRVKSTLKYSVQRMTPTKAVRIALLVISDALILNIASFLALWVRFEFHFEQLVRETEYLNNILRFAPYYTAFGLIVFALFKLYTSLWQFASIDEFLKIILACFIVDAGGYAGMHFAQSSRAERNIHCNNDNRCAFFIQIYAPIQAGKQQLQADDDNRRGAGSDGCPAGVPRKHTFRKQSRLPYRR